MREYRAISDKHFFQSLSKYRLFYVLALFSILGLVWWWWWRNTKSWEGEMEGHWRGLRCRWGWSVPFPSYTEFSAYKLITTISVDRKNEVIVQVLMLPLICMCCILLISIFIDMYYMAVLSYIFQVHVFMELTGCIVLPFLLKLCLCDLGLVGAVVYACYWFLGYIFERKRPWYTWPQNLNLLLLHVYILWYDLPVLSWCFWYDLSYSIVLNQSSCPFLSGMSRVFNAVLLFDLQIMSVVFDYWSGWKSRECKGCESSYRLCWVLQEIF